MNPPQRRNHRWRAQGCCLANAIKGAALCLGLLLGGCSGGADESGRGQLELGTGEQAFEEFDDGDPLRLAAGTQGGYHLWISMHVEGLATGRSRMQLTLTPRDPKLRVSSSDVGIFLEAGDAPGDPLVYAGWPARLLDAPCAAGDEVDIEVVLTDRDGVRAEAVATVKALAPEGGFAEDCSPPG